jgi:hypothetical protein
MELSRRGFLAAAPGALAAANRVTVKEAASLKARPFPMKQVRLLDGNLFFLMERDRGYLHDLEADRLLHMFRVTAGLPSTAEPLAGWERPDIELRGHFTGHYLSACALMYASTNDGRLKSKVDGMVAELVKCQRANGGGYLSAFPPELFDRLRDGMPVWAPFYTLHKIMAGMYDLYVHTGNEQALGALEGIASWTANWAGDLNDAHMARVLEREYGGMNEVLCNLYAVTGDRKHLDLAHRFDHERIFAPLAAGRDELKGLHVNTTIPKIIGAARRYELTGDARYRDIAEYFWRQVTGHRCYATGGTSNVERWRTEPDVLASELGPTTEECCCTYNMLKLTRHVFGWTADARCGDYYERAFLNGIIGTMNPDDAMTMYYIPLQSGYWKMFSTPRRSFWCCTGTGVENFAKLADSIYFHDDDGLYVNLFSASRLEWPEKGLAMRQETRFPEEERSSLEFKCDRPVQLAVRIRVPYWATRGIRLAVNGESVAENATPGTFAVVNRTWKTGDRVNIELPMGLHVHSMPDDASIQAVLYGPLVLAGRLGAARLTWDMKYGDPHNARGGKLLRGDPVAAPEFHSPSRDPSNWIKRASNDSLTFVTTGQSENVTLIPLNSLFNERYAVYWRVRAKA